MEHVPVLLRESIDGLNIKHDGTYVDGTLGRAGHALEIVRRLTCGRLIAIDRDKDALSAAEKLLSDFKGQITFIHGNFRNITKLLAGAGVSKADGMLFDLGVSSPQLDNSKRGFSYMNDAKLDMRMDESESLTAFEVVNTWDEDKLKKIFYEYGEERYSKSIAREIVRGRDIAPINTTFELSDIIINAIPAAARREKQHPSKRCFQAIRIAVNDELDSIRDMLDAVPSLLNPQGRLCVISFHSLEDRLVKRSFAEGAKGCTCPKDMPVCVCSITPTIKLITRKPLTAGRDESEQNPRARSAKLRVAEKL